MKSNSVQLVTQSGRCVGCAACAGCEHIEFRENDLGFPAPVVKDSCTNCGACLDLCDVID